MFTKIKKFYKQKGWYFRQIEWANKGTKIVYVTSAWQTQACVLFIISYILIVLLNRLWVDVSECERLEEIIFRESEWERKIEALRKKEEDEEGINEEETVTSTLGEMTITLCVCRNGKKGGHE